MSPAPFGASASHDMISQPELSDKLVICFGGELFRVLDELKTTGWRVASVSVKGNAEYHVRAYLVDELSSPEQSSLPGFRESE
jgi:hypothetical protein